ncbi:putative endonuclease [Acetitomaculum ruminis DSM 5522]|uniref:UPF0102 protein SAMN05216249_102106 n=1 Tax=Acetitomaculum ruminis DSM 5522 TaxID=1120918 RepID=A0A1I0VNC0_9FIRM|nr:YraN family protein [Acetitomaculum ruminis]SFA77915.1 putative endonuclease [Acetitomaculum ruminis DSM 5522]
MGSENEIKAAAYLESKGYLILDRNFRMGKSGEIDLVAKSGETYVFVECKFRNNKKYGDPLEAVNYKKQKQISKTAMFYYIKKGIDDTTPCRFDVVAIYTEGKIKHIENAFDFVI